MINWRRPILKFYDTHITKNPVPGYIGLLSEFYTSPVEQRRKVQAEQLSKILLHASRNVPYYRELLLKQNIVRGDRVDLSRFSELPELSREILQSEFERLKSEDLETRAWYKYASGGSSGIPAVVVQDQGYNDIGNAAIDLIRKWAGRESGEPLVVFWGSERDVLLGTVGWRNRITNFVRNQTFCNSWNMSKAQLQEYARRVERRRPVIIEAYAESVYELARYINDEDIPISGVRGVVTSAGTLYPFMREEIERAFSCQVLNRYGSREVGTFAAEMKSGAGLIVSTYTHLVEVVDEYGEPCKPGEEGDVLVTCLTNYAMPIFRYRIGDRAVVGASSATPTPSVEQLRSVTGRIMDTFVREDGTTIPGNFFMHFLGTIHNRGWLRKAQVIQEDYNKILIKMIADTPPPAETMEEIRQSFKKAMGPACEIDFMLVDSIPPLASGKYRYVVSHVQHPRLAKAYPLSSALERHKIAS